MEKGKAIYMILALKISSFMIRCKDAVGGGFHSTKNGLRKRKACLAESFDFSLSQ